MKPAIVISLLLVTGTACATTTTISSDAPDARVSVDGVDLGTAPVDYTTRSWIFATHSVTVTSEKHGSNTVELKRSDFQVLPTVVSACGVVSGVGLPLGCLFCFAGFDFPKVTYVGLGALAEIPPLTPEEVAEQERALRERELAADAKKAEDAAQEKDDEEERRRKAAVLDALAGALEEESARSRSNSSGSSGSSGGSSGGSAPVIKRQHTQSCSQICADYKDAGQYTECVQRCNKSR